VRDCRTIQIFDGTERWQGGSEAFLLLFDGGTGSTFGEDIGVALPQIGQRLLRLEA
jgi:hypothetical protein